MAIIYVLSVWAGRLTVPPGESLSLVWPAAGVSVIWLHRYAARR